MEKIWLKNYPPGVPAEINPDAYESIIDFFNKSCQQFADKPAFYNAGVTLTYSQIDEYSRAFAAYLQKDLKLKPGDRFAIMLPNTLHYPIALFGALRAGLIVVNINPLYTADELAYLLNNAQVETIIGLTNFAATIEQALPQVSVNNVIIANVSDFFSPAKAIATKFALKYIYKVPEWKIPDAIHFKQALSKGQKQQFIPVSITNQDIAFLQYTGGTTGVSKAAILTHRNIVANVEQADEWFKNILTKGKEIIITALPLYHIFSLTANCLFFTKIGGLNVLITDPRNLTGMIKEMRKFKFTAITGVNTLFNALLQKPDFAKLDFTPLRLALGGGMAVQRIVAEKWQNITRSPLLEAYGLTEASPCVTINPSTLKTYNGTIGLPVPSTDVLILDDNYKEVPVGQPGELAVKGPQVMKGYWQNPAETEKVFTKSGWLLTGDIACINEQGYITIVERKKDMILVSGFNVYPNEIEDVIARMPGVLEVAIVGVHDEHSGEAVKAFIVKSNPKLTIDEIIEFAHKHLTAYKVPKHIEFRKELPKSNVGKILRRFLKNEIKDLNNKKGNIIDFGLNNSAGGNH